MEIFKAHQQWANRPADETFESVEAMHAACDAYRQVAIEASGVPYGSLRVQADGGEILLVGRKNAPARLTNWAFGQLAQRAGAPASYMRELPATLAGQCINHGLAARPLASDGAPDNCNILIHRNGDLVVRALTSDRYDRIWNSDVTARLLQLVSDQPQWHLPEAYVKGADGSLSNYMAPRGAYASDHDMFCFLVDTTRPIDAGNGSPLNRGFFVWNSEVGASSFGVMAFLFDHVCGNHIVWGAQGVVELRVRHVGEANDRAFNGLAVELRKYSESSASGIEQRIQTARATVLGQDKDAVLDAILGKRIPEFSRKRLGEAWDLAAQAGRYGSPRTVWGMVNGLTELSQLTPHTDERVKLDRAAGRLLQIDF